MKTTQRFFERAPSRFFLFASSVRLLACALSAASAAELALDGRWMDAAGNAVTNATVAATMNIYTNDAVNEEAVTTAPVTLATDADGFFRTTATNLTLPAECRTYWLGVVPDGQDEIAPRMKVSPAPFALRAAEARALEASELTVEGTVTIGTLSNADAEVERLTVTNQLSVGGSLTGLDNLHLGEIDLGEGGALSLFRRAEIVSRRLSVGTPDVGWNASDRWSLRSEDDAILQVRVGMHMVSDGAISDEIAQMFYDGTEVFLSIDNRDFEIRQDYGEALFVGPDKYRYFTLPVRAKKTVHCLMGLNRRWNSVRDVEMVVTVECELYSAGVE